MNENHIQHTQDNFGIATGYSRKGLKEFAQYWISKQHLNVNEIPSANDTRAKDLLISYQSAALFLYQSLDYLYYYGQPDQSKISLQKVFQYVPNWTRANYFYLNIEQNLASLIQISKLFNQGNISEIRQNLDQINRDESNEFAHWFQLYDTVYRIDNEIGSLTITENQLEVINSVLVTITGYERQAAYDPVILPFFCHLKKAIDTVLADLIESTETTIISFLRKAKFDEAIQYLQLHSHLYTYASSRKFIGINTCNGLITSSIAKYTLKKEDVDHACKEKDFSKALQIIYEMLDLFPGDEYLKNKSTEIAGSINQKETLTANWQEMLDQAKNQGEKLSKRYRAIKNALLFIHSQEATFLIDTNGLQLLLNETIPVSRDVSRRYVLKNIMLCFTLLLFSIGFYYTYHKITINSFSFLTKLYSDKSKMFLQNPLQNENEVKEENFKKFRKNPTIMLNDTIKLEMVYIPAGNFLMGSTEKEIKYLVEKYKEQAIRRADIADEIPQHQVTIKQGFWMGKYEITNQQFQVFVEKTNYKTTAEKKGEGISYDSVNKKWGVRIKGADWKNLKLPWKMKGTWADHPAAMLSWEDAKAFCQWLQTIQQNGLECRLPTEAEWEYACRAGTSTRRWWGDDDKDDQAYRYANVADESNGWEKSFKGDDGHKISAPVGIYQQNGFGLYDMLGNVLEWCEDSYGPYNAVKQNDPNTRIYRGGSWSTDSGNIRSANRSKRNKDYTLFNLGFRIVLVQI